MVGRGGTPDSLTATVTITLTTTLTQGPMKNIINSLIGEELCREKGYASATNAMVVAIYIDA